MANPFDASSMTNRQIFFKILSEAIRNVFWYGGATVVITIIGRAVWWWAGIILFGIFALIVVASSLHTLIGTVMGLISIPLGIFVSLKGVKVDVKEQLYLGGAQAIHVVELAILAVYTVWLYRVFF